MLLMIGESGFWRGENLRQIFPATLSLTLAHSPQPIGREVAELRITDQEDERGGAGYVRQ